MGLCYITQEEVYNSSQQNDRLNPLDAPSASTLSEDLNYIRSVILTTYGVDKNDSNNAWYKVPTFTLKNLHDRLTSVEQGNVSVFVPEVTFLNSFNSGRKTVSIPSSTQKWIRIAQSPSNANNNFAVFEVRWTVPGQHGHILFSVGANFGNQSALNINVLSQSSYSTVGIEKIRVLENDTYDQMYIEIYVKNNQSSYNMTVEVRRMFGYGWQLIDIVDGSLPSGYSEHVATTSFPFRINKDENSFVVTYDGKVGMGTNNPQSKFHIHSGGSVSTYSFLSSYLGILQSWDTDLVFFGLEDKGYDRKDAVLIWGDNSNDNLRIKRYDYSGTTYEYVTITGTGNVGINTTSPTERLHVAGNLKVDNYAYISQGVGIGTTNLSGLLNISGDINRAIALKRTSTTTRKSEIVWLNNSDSGIKSIGIDLHENNTNNFYIYDDATSSTHFFISETGNVGIGNTSPSAKLDVSGDVKARTLAATIRGRFGASSSSVRYIVPNPNKIINSSGELGLEGWTVTSGSVSANREAESGLQFESSGTFEMYTDVLIWRNTTNYFFTIEKHHGGGNLQVKIELYDSSYNFISLLYDWTNVGVDILNLDLNGKFTTTSASGILRIYIRSTDTNLKRFRNIGLYSGLPGLPLDSKEPVNWLYTNAEIKRRNEIVTGTRTYRNFVTIDGNSSANSWLRIYSHGSIPGQGGLLFSQGDSTNRFVLYTTNTGSSGGKLQVFYKDPSGNDVSGASLYLGNINLGVGVLNPSEKIETNGNVKANRFISTVSTGTSPLQVSSTTLVTNLNSDLLDGYHAVDFPRKAENATITGSWTFNSNTTFSGNITTDNNNVVLGNAGNYTSNGWKKGLSLPLGYAIFWPKGSNSVSYGIGAATNGGLYFITSTADDNSQPASYPVFLSTSGNLGIGTTSPSEKLHVSGNILATGYVQTNTLQAKNSPLLINARNWGIEFRIDEDSSGGDVIKFTKGSGGSTTLVTITNNGNVGIGTTSPSTNLHISSTAGSKIVLQQISTSNKKSEIAWRNSSGTTIYAIGTDANSNNSDNFFIWDATSSTHRLFFNPNGTGIGTNDPKTSLHIHTSGTFGNLPPELNASLKGILQTWDSDYVFLGLENIGTNRKDPVLLWGDDSTDNLRIKRYDSSSGTTYEYVTITGTGNVGIGTTSPAGKLHVSGNIIANGYIGINTSNPQHYLDIWTGNKTIKTYSHGLEITTNTNGGWSQSIRFRNEYDNKTAVFGSLSGGAYIKSNVDISSDPTGYINPDLFIDLNGNVGIGKSNPTEKLDVNGNIKLNGAIIKNSYYRTLYPKRWGFASNIHTSANKWQKVATLTINGNYNKIHLHAIIWGGRDIDDQQVTQHLVASIDSGNSSSIDVSNYILALYDEYQNSSGTTPRVIKDVRLVIPDPTSAPNVAELWIQWGIAYATCSPEIHIVGGSATDIDVLMDVYGDASTASTSPPSAGTVLTPNHVSVSDKLSSPRTISLSGDVSGSVSFDGSSDVTISTSISSNIPRKNSNETISGIWHFSNKLGVGVSSPTEKLEISGNLKLSNSDSKIIFSNTRVQNIRFSTTSGPKFYKICDLPTESAVSIRGTFVDTGYFSKRSVSFDLNFGTGSDGFPYISGVVNGRFSIPKVTFVIYYVNNVYALYLYTNSVVYFNFDIQVLHGSTSIVFDPNIYSTTRPSNPQRILGVPNYSYNHTKINFGTFSLNEPESGSMTIYTGTGINTVNASEIKYFLSLSSSLDNGYRLSIRPRLYRNSAGYTGQGTLSYRVNLDYFYSNYGIFINDTFSDIYIGSLSAIYPTLTSIHVSSVTKESTPSTENDSWYHIVEYGYITEGGTNFLEVVVYRNYSGSDRVSMPIITLDLAMF